MILVESVLQLSLVKTKPFIFEVLRSSRLVMKKTMRSLLLTH